MNLKLLTEALAADALADILAGSNPAKAMDHQVDAYEYACMLGGRAALSGDDMPACFDMHPTLKQGWHDGHESYFVEEAIAELEAFGY